MEVWAAISLGLISSLHCAGMCGPIAFALPLDRSSVWRKTSGALLYQAGRLLTYGLLGALFGLLGKALFTAGFQRGVSIVIGLAFILAVAVPLLLRKGLFLEKMGFRLIGRWQGVFRNQFRKHSPEALFTIGLLNGLLPCGMVYLGLAGAVGTGTFLSGFWFMVLFGVGTLPVMGAASLASDVLSTPLRLRLRKAVPYLVVVMGLWFVLRGLNLGIPYVSPVIDQVQPGVTQCD